MEGLVFARLTARLLSLSLLVLLVGAIRPGAALGVSEVSSYGTWALMPGVPWWEGASSAEGNPGDDSTSMSFDVAFTPTSGYAGVVSVGYYTDDPDVDWAASGSPALCTDPGQDYISAGSAGSPASLTVYLDGSRSTVHTRINIEVCHDLILEPEEVFELRLAALSPLAPVGSVDGNAMRSGSIYPDDGTLDATGIELLNSANAVDGMVMTLVGSVAPCYDGICGGVAPGATGTMTFYVSLDMMADGSYVETGTAPVVGGKATMNVTVTAPDEARYMGVRVVYSGDGQFIPCPPRSAIGFWIQSHGPEDHIAISPTSSTTKAGAGVSYTAHAWDAYNHDLGDVTASTTFTGTSGGVSCVGNTCRSTQPGTGSISAVYNGFTTTAGLTVLHGDAAKLVITPASASVSASGAQQYQAITYDAYDNRIADVTATTEFRIDGALCSGASCSSGVAGSRVVTATYQGLTASAQLLVSSGAVAPTKAPAAPTQAPAAPAASAAASSGSATSTPALIAAASAAASSNEIVAGASSAASAAPTTSPTSGDSSNGGQSQLPILLVLGLVGVVGLAVVARFAMVRFSRS
jgi:hypothetical protein